MHAIHMHRCPSNSTATTRLRAYVGTHSLIPSVCLCPAAEHELSFQQGDVMLLEMRLTSNPDWCVCVLGDEKGLVPYNYIESMDEFETQSHLAALDALA